MDIQVNTASEIFKTNDAGSYDHVTAEFDQFTKRLTQPLAERLVALARLQPGEHVLDVGTGTGVVAFPAAAQVGTTGKVVGIDLSQGMLARARENAALFGPLNIEFRRVDAESLDLPPGSFDAVLSLFALLHFPNPQIALQEMFRVLRPRGRLIIGVGSGPSRLSLRAIIEALRHLDWFRLRIQGKLLTAPTALNRFLQDRLPPSSEPDESRLANRSRHRAGSVPPLLSQVGFKIVGTCWQGHQAVIGTPGEFWDLQRTFSSIARKRLGRVSPDQIRALREQFLRRCQAVQARGGRLIYPFGAFFMVAQRLD